MLTDHRVVVFMQCTCVCVLASKCVIVVNAKSSGYSVHSLLHYIGVCCVIREMSTLTILPCLSFLRLHNAYLCFWPNCLQNFFPEKVQPADRSIIVIYQDVLFICQDVWTSYLSARTSYFTALSYLSIF